LIESWNQLTFISALEKMNCKRSGGLFDRSLRAFRCSVSGASGFEDRADTAFMILQRRLQIIVICLGALAIPCAATGAPIHFRMTGTIDVQFQVGPLPPGFFQGGPFEAILSYELAAPDNRPDDSQRGYYFSPPERQDDFLLIRAGTSEIRSVDDLSFFVGNDIDQPQELFEFRDDTFAMRDVQFVGNFQHSAISKLVFRWNDPTRSVFNSDALPNSLDPTRFVEAFSASPGPPDAIPPFIEISTFEIDSRVHQFTLRAFVDSIDVVPEPATVFSTVIAIGIMAPLLGRLRLRPTNISPVSSQ
jgi:hypothetical protein